MDDKIIIIMKMVWEKCFALVLTHNFVYGNNRF